MGNINSKESFHKQEVLNKTWEYLNDNFHKFSEDKKIKISISLCAKSMPTIVEGNYSVTKMPTVKLNDKEQELNIGNRIASHIESASQADTSDYRV